MHVKLSWIYKAYINNTSIIFAMTFFIALRNNFLRSLRTFSIFNSWNYNSNCRKKEDKFGAWSPCTKSLFCLIEGDDEKSRENTHFRIFLALINLTNSAPEANVAKSESSSIYSKVKLFKLFLCPMGVQPMFWISRERKERYRKYGTNKLYILILRNGSKSQINIYWVNSNLGPSLKQKYF